MTPRSNASALISQAEYLHAMDENGLIKVFFVTQTQETDGFFAVQKTESRIVDEDLIIEKMNPFTAQVKAFVKEKKLKLKRKVDLLKMLDYYEELASL